MAITHAPPPPPPAPHASTSYAAYPVTPPMTPPTLPSLAQFDRQISSRHFASPYPLTPDDDAMPGAADEDVDVDEENAEGEAEAEGAEGEADPLARPGMIAIDWRSTRSAHYLAEKTCEMICYLWFAAPTPSHSSTNSNNPNNSTSPCAKARPRPLQLVTTAPFVQFMQTLLETTQVSHSVIVLALHYIARLKERAEKDSSGSGSGSGAGNEAQPGSEFRIAVAGLMMANKFLDDNTYTNRTWADVSGISLHEINRMEREFLQGVGFDLYVDKRTYERWLWMLRGLVEAKEREKGVLSPSKTRRRRHHPHHHHHHHLHLHHSNNPNSHAAKRTRARSTSPPTTTTTHLPPLRIPSPTPRMELGKRSAEAAFSPTSATFGEGRPVKRAQYALGLGLPPFIHVHVPPPPPVHSHHTTLPPIQTQTQTQTQPQQNQSQNQTQQRTPVYFTQEPSPLESFGRMSLSSDSPMQVDGGAGVGVGKKTLKSACTRREEGVPETLYFYALAKEPTRTLRCHRPPSAAYYQPAHYVYPSSAHSGSTFAFDSSTSSTATTNSSSSSSHLHPSSTHANSTTTSSNTHPTNGSSNSNLSASNANLSAPQPYTSYTYTYPTPPAYTQSARASPADTDMDIPPALVPAYYLPPLNTHLPPVSTRSHSHSRVSPSPKYHPYSTKGDYRSSSSRRAEFDSSSSSRRPEFDSSKGGALELPPALVQPVALPALQHPRPVRPVHVVELEAVEYQQAQSLGVGGDGRRRGRVGEQHERGRVVEQHDRRVGDREGREERWEREGRWEREVRGGRWERVAVSAPFANAGPPGVDFYRCR